MSQRIARTPGERAARALVLGLLGRIRDGAVILHDGDRRYLCGRPLPGERVPEARVLAPETWRAVATEGSVGLGRAWFSGWWTCDDLDDLTLFLRVVLRNLDAIEVASAAANRVATPLRRLRSARGEEHAGGELHTPDELDDEALALLLDATRSCSAGLFASASTSLEDAQVAKLDRLGRALGLSPADHVLELGTHWASFAVHAARTYGCKVTATTTSARERDRAAARVKEEGLEDLVTVVEEDHESLSGTFDKLVAIETMEGLGWRQHDDFLAACARLLAPSGLMALESVVVADQRYERSRRTEDFVKAYVRPGSALPSVTSLVEAAGRVGDLRLVSLEDIANHYAETLRRWRRRLVERREALAETGVNEASRLLLELYLCYREAAAAERRIGDVQCVFARSRWRPAGLGPRRL